jgi:hypothetical protein
LALLPPFPWTGQVGSGLIVVRRDATEPIEWEGIMDESIAHQQLTWR